MIIFTKIIFGIDNTVDFAIMILHQYIQKTVRLLLTVTLFYEIQMR